LLWEGATKGSVKLTDLVIRDIWPVPRFLSLANAARSFTRSSKVAGVTTSSPKLICTRYWRGCHPWPIVRLKTLFQKPGQQPGETLLLEQPKHCKGGNSNLRPLQFLRVNRSMQGAWRDAYDASRSETWFVIRLEALQRLPFSARPQSPKYQPPGTCEINPSVRVRTGSKTLKPSRPHVLAWWPADTWLRV